MYKSIYCCTGTPCFTQLSRPVVYGFNNCKHSRQVKVSGYYLFNWLTVILPNLLYNLRRLYPPSGYKIPVYVTYDGVHGWYSIVNGNFKCILLKLGVKTNRILMMGCTKLFKDLGY